MPFRHRKTRGNTKNEQLDAPLKELGSALNSIRRRLDVAQIELGNLTGCQQSEISYYENGKELPCVKRLIRFLRLATEDTERRPILAALERHGLLSSDLSPSLLETVPAEQETAGFDGNN